MNWLNILVVILLMLIIYDACQFFYHYLTAKKALAICQKKELDFVRQVGKGTVHIVQSQPICFDEFATYCGLLIGNQSSQFFPAIISHPTELCLYCSIQLIRLYQFNNEP